MTVTTSSVPDPILHYRFALDNPDTPIGTWAACGDHHIWHARFAPDHPPLETWEMHKAGIVRLPLKDHTLNMIPAGTPYHIEHLFGFWRVSAADTIWLRSMQTDAAYHVMLIGGVNGPNVAEETVWYCPGCGRDMVRHKHDRGGAPEAYWKTQLGHVRTFNGDVLARTCMSCGAVHPVVYGFFPDDDRPDEASARRAGWSKV